mmetsp:Transcript_108414/g.313251  ORF Transcript_108414/g.313251 Transcript_108414/m.313251 type:complete len:92 (+) Transcript_108414:377-652(+)
MGLVKGRYAMECYDILSIPTFNEKRYIFFHCKLLCNTMRSRPRIDHSKEELVGGGRLFIFYFLSTVQRTKCGQNIQSKQTGTSCRIGPVYR